MFFLKKMKIGKMFALPSNFFLFLIGLAILYFGLFLTMGAFQDRKEASRWNLQQIEPSSGLETFLK